jgi:integrase
LSTILLKPDGLKTAAARPRRPTHIRVSQNAPVCNALHDAWGTCKPEQRVPELDTPAIRRSVFLLPGSVTKNGRPRLAILNDVAQSIVESQRGEHDTYVFTFLDFRGERTRLGTLRNSGWIAARRRASVRYREELGKSPAKGFQRIRAHDLRHTFGRLLRAAGVSLEDRQDLLGHESGRVTTHYSSAEVANLVKAANAITESRKSPTRTVLRLISPG